MSNRGEAEKSEVVQHLVLECLKAADPSCCIKEFVERLVKEQGWMQTDADEVAETAARVLQTVGPHLGSQTDWS
jgi:hypothetical protein